MKLTVQPDRVYADLAPGYRGERHRTTNPLGKYGVRCDWDGHGGLLGIEIPVALGVEVDLDVTTTLGDIIAAGSDRRVDSLAAG